MKNYFPVALILLTTSCTHTITLDAESKIEHPKCLVRVDDRRIDRRLITPQPGTTYSYPVDYPVDRALRNKLCQTRLSDKEVTVYLKHAKCQGTGDFGKPEVALEASVKSFTTPVVAVKNNDSGTSMIGSHCGYNLNEAIDEVVSQIVYMMN